MPEKSGQGPNGVAVAEGREQKQRSLRIGAPARLVGAPGALRESTPGATAPTRRGGCWVACHLGADWGYGARGRRCMATASPGERRRRRFEKAYRRRALGIGMEPRRDARYQERFQAVNLCQARAGACAGQEWCPSWRAGECDGTLSLHLANVRYSRAPSKSKGRSIGLGRTGALRAPSIRTASRTFTANVSCPVALLFPPPQRIR